jgi:hypothetical protein
MTQGLPRTICMRGFTPPTPFLYIRNVVYTQPGDVLQERVCADM